MRNALIIPINKHDSLVITTDNSGAIGMKEQDSVKVAYDIVGYFSFRVAMMECLAVGSRPIAVVVQNFCGEKEWDFLVTGVKKGLAEIGLEGVKITGSTESNFPLVQSVVGLNVIGVKSKDDGRKGPFEKVALIGKPLIGEEVMTQAKDVAPLSLFYKMSLLENVMLWPIGSKGVEHELKRMGFETGEISTEIDLLKSGGPATSFLVSYQSDREKEIKELAGQYYYSLENSYSG